MVVVKTARIITLVCPITATYASIVGGMIMKRVITFVLLGIVSMIMAGIGQAQNFPMLIYIGVGLGGFLVLSLVVYLINFLFRLLGTNISSFLFMSAICAIAGILIWHGFVNPIISYGMGIAIGLIITVFALRKIGKVAQSSTIFGELFGFVTGYKVKAYVTRNSIISADAKESDTAEYKNIILILHQQLGFPKRKARELADYAITEVPDAPIEQKIEKALQYQGSLN